MKYKVNPDLENERKKCTFNIDEFTSWWCGGPLKLKEKRERGNLVANLLWLYNGFSPPYKIFDCPICMLCSCIVSYCILLTYNKFLL